MVPIPLLLVTGTGTWVIWIATAGLLAIITIVMLLWMHTFKSMNVVFGFLQQI